MIDALHFLRPWWWLAWLPLPLMLLALMRGGSGRAALERLADAALLPALLRDAGARRGWAIALAALTWTLAVAALAGPAWRRAPTALYANGGARVIALSLSDDMRAQDIKPDRLTRARYAVRDLLAGAGDARTALVAYAGDAFVVAPLTLDKRTVLNLLDALSPDVMPVPGNDAARAIDQSLALLQQAHVRGGEIVVVTDTARHAALAVARKARVAGVRVDVLGIGTTQGAPVPRADGGFEQAASGVLIARRTDAALRDLAQAGGGTYAPLRNDGSGVAAIGAPAAVQGAVASDQHARSWRDGGAWLLIPLLPLAALAFRRGWLCALALLFVIPHARASTWDSLWARPDQRALHALDQGDYAQAGKLARDPVLRGAAAYRNGDFALAAKAFAHTDDARAHYDRGNALAMSGHYDQAILAYDQAIKRDPHLADARTNRQAVLDWLRRHPSQSSPQQKGQGAQASSPASSQQQASNASQSSNGQRQSPSKAAANGAPNDTPKRNAQGGANRGNANDPDRAASARGQAANPAQSAGDSGTSQQEDARQRAQAQRARQGLQAELAKRGARGDRQAAAANANNNGAKGAQHAFALGADQAGEDGKFDPQQRAMMDAVPDDPGALLRRKFLLEWQRRNGQAPDDQTTDVNP